MAYFYLKNGNLLFINLLVYTPLLKLYKAGTFKLFRFRPKVKTVVPKPWNTGAWTARCVSNPSLSAELLLFKEQV